MSVRSDVNIFVNKLAAQSPVLVWFQMERLHLA